MISKNLFFLSIFSLVFSLSTFAKDIKCGDTVIGECGNIYESDYSQKVLPCPTKQELKAFCKKWYPKK